MDTYLVMLLVTVEQENAIRYLYDQRGWKYFKTGSRAPVKEELNLLYENLLTEKPSDNIFRNLHPYLQMGYIEHQASQQFQPLTSFARNPLIPYSLHDPHRNTSQLNSSINSTTGMFAGSLGIQVPPTSTVLATGSALPYADSHASDSVNCISKSLIMLDNIDGNQYTTDSSEVFSGQGMNPSVSLDCPIVTSVDKPVCQAATVGSIAEEWRTTSVSYPHVKPGYEEKKNKSMSDLLADNSAKNTSGFAKDLTDYSPTVDYGECSDVSKEKCSCKTAEAEEDVCNVGNNIVTYTYKEEMTHIPKEHLESAKVEGPNRMIENLVLEELRKYKVKDLNIEAVKASVCNFIQLEIEKCRLDDSNADDGDSATEVEDISMGEDSFAVSQVKILDHNREKMEAKDISSKEEKLKWSDIANTALRKETTQRQSVSPMDTNILNGKVTKLDKNNKSAIKMGERSENVEHLTAFQKSVKYVGKFKRNSFLMKSKEDKKINENKAEDMSFTQKFKRKTSEGNTYQYPKVKTNINTSRKHRWAVNRNIRMHSCHRKCKELPSDLDVNNYSITEQGYYCPDCRFVFTSEKKLYLHKKLKGGHCSPDCIYCDKDNYKEIFDCSKCPKCFSTKELLEKHIERHTVANQFTCQFCESLFFTSAELRFHIQSSHAEQSQSTYLCDLCGAKFTEKKVLNAHRKYVHTDERPEVCTTCGSRFKTKSQLKNHLVRHKNLKELNLSCEICGKMFLRVATLKDHVRRHNKDFTVFCSVCGKGFYRKYELDEHMRIHTGIKPFECKICAHKCSLRCNLVKHMKIHRQKSDSILGPDVIIL